MPSTPCPATNPTAGFTLLELLICLFLLSVLLVSSTPGLESWLQRSRADQAQASLLSLLQYARNSALTFGVPVSVCGSASLAVCDGEWSAGVLVFLDDDGDGQRSIKESALRGVAGTDQVSLAWRAFGNRSFLQFTPQGFTRGQSGNFTLCVDGGTAPLARQLIVSAGGRVRIALDTDGDGRLENANGDPLRC